MNIYSYPHWQHLHGQILIIKSSYTYIKESTGCDYAVQGRASGCKQISSLSIKMTCRFMGYQKPNHQSYRKKTCLSIELQSNTNNMAPLRSTPRAASADTKWSQMAKPARIQRDDPFFFFGKHRTSLQTGEKKHGDPTQEFDSNPGDLKSPVVDDPHRRWVNEGTGMDQPQTSMGWSSGLAHPALRTPKSAVSVLPLWCRSMTLSWHVPGWHVAGVKVFDGAKMGQIWPNSTLVYVYYIHLHIYIMWNILCIYIYIYHVRIYSMSLNGFLWWIGINRAK